MSITPAPSLRPIMLLERGAVRRRRARAIVAQLSPRIADRELAVVRKLLGWSDDELETVVVEKDARGPGNALLLEIESEHVTEVFTGFGEYGMRAEAVADCVAQRVRRYLAAGVPVGPYLADQLMIPLALAGGGAFRTIALSSHATTHVQVIRMFLGVPFAMIGDRDDLVVRVGSQS